MRRETKAETIVGNLALFEVHTAARFKKIRLEIRRLERRVWWVRLRRALHRFRWLMCLLLGHRLDGPFSDFGDMPEGVRGCRRCGIWNYDLCERPTPWWNR